MRKLPIEVSYGSRWFQLRAVFASDSRWNTIHKLVVIDTCGASLSIWVPSSRPSCELIQPSRQGREARACEIPWRWQRT